MRHAADESPPGFADPLTGIGVRTARWKYVRYIDGDAELYDLARDPNEMHNLYGRKSTPKSRPSCRELWTRLPQLRRHRVVVRPCHGPCRSGPTQLAKLTRRQEQRRASPLRRCRL